MKLFLSQALSLVLLLCGITLTAQSTNQATDSLVVDAKNVLDEVVLLDTRMPIKRTQSGKPVIVIGEEEIRQFEGRSLAALLTTKSGLILLGNRSITGQNLRAAVRGSANNQVLILVDGVRISDPSRIGNDFDLNFLSLSDIASIEILKGGASTLYGSAAAAGVINIVTKKAEEGFRLVLNAQAGTEKSANQSPDALSYSSSSLRLSNRHQRLHYSVGFSSQSASGMSAVANGTETDPFDRYNFNAHIGQDKHRFQWRLMASKATINNDYDNTFPLEDADFEAESILEQLAFNADFDYRKGKLSARTGLQTTQRDYRDGFPRAYRATNRSVELLHTYPINDRFYTVQGYLYQEGVYAETPAIHQNDVFANVVYLSEEGMNVNAGVRWNNHQTYGDQMTYHVNPSYTIAGKKGRLKLLGSINSAFIAPSLYQLYDLYSGNSDLQPEQSTSLEVGAQWEDATTTTGLVFFQRREDPKIIYDLTTYAYANASGNTQISGVEFNFKRDFSAQWSVDLNYTFTQLNEGRLIRIPKHALNGHLTYSFNKQQQLSMVYAYRGERQAADAEGTLLDAYGLLDLNYTKEFSEKLRLSVWVTNLFDKEYVELLGFSTQGRNFRLGLNYVF